MSSIAPAQRACPFWHVTLFWCGQVLEEARSRLLTAGVPVTMVGGGSVMGRHPSLLPPPSPLFPPLERAPRLAIYPTIYLFPLLWL